MSRTVMNMRIVGLFVAVAWVAIFFACAGILVVIIDRDPITVQVSPFYALIAYALALGFVYLGVVRYSGRHDRPPWLGACASAAAVYLVLVFSATPVGFALVITQALSPFVFLASVLAGLIIIATWVIFHPERGSRKKSRNSR